MPAWCVRSRASAIHATETRPVLRATAAPVRTRAPAPEVFSLEQLHDQVWRLRDLVYAGIENIDDVFAADLSRESRLLHEALAKLVTLDRMRQHDLERAAPLIGHRMNDFIDRAHPAVVDASSRIDTQSTDWRKPRLLGAPQPPFGPIEVTRIADRRAVIPLVVVATDEGALG